MKELNRLLSCKIAIIHLKRDEKREVDWGIPLVSHTVQRQQMRIDDLSGENTPNNSSLFYSLVNKNSCQVK